MAARAGRKSACAGRRAATPGGDRATHCPVTARHHASKAAFESGAGAAMKQSNSFVTECLVNRAVRCCMFSVVRVLSTEVQILADQDCDAPRGLRRKGG